MDDEHSPADPERRFCRFSWHTLSPAEAVELSAEARARDGLAHSEVDGGFHITARYADVLAVQDNPAIFSSHPSVFRPYAKVPPFPPLEIDPPHHEMWRNVFRDLINPRTIRKLEPQILADVDRCIDGFIETGEAELVADLAEHVPVETICRVGGITDRELAARIRIVAQAALDTGGRDPEAFVRNISIFGDLFRPIVEARRAAPQDDFLSHVVTAEIGGARLDDITVRGVLFSLFAAGYHSTASSMASLFVNVLSRPEVLAAVGADAKLIPMAIEESLRLSPPFFGFFRRAAVDTELAGTPITKDESVILNLASANLDPAEFENPTEFRLDRTRNRHLAFGWGIHLCIGAPLARLELKIALQRMLERLPDLRLVGTPKRHFGGAGANYLDAVHVRFTPGERSGQP